METIDQIRERLLAAVAGATIELVPSTPAAQQPSLLVDRDHLVAVAQLLRDDSALRLDYCSCVTAVDFLPQAEKPGAIEVVYHLYSVVNKLGPVVLKVRAPRELDQCRLPSLTPLWRGCEFQEREAYDLYGVKFDGHPDLRRILMWEEFQDHPMRRDYQPPPDYEWEPTPHEGVLQRALQTDGVVPPSAAAAEAQKAAKAKA